MRSRTGSAMVTMNSDIMHTNHRRLETAFQSAAKARNQGAQEVTIEWFSVGVPLSSQWAFQKTSDGVYARLRGCVTPEAVMRIHNFCLKHGLPFSPTASWARTDGTPVCEPEAIPEVTPSVQGVLTPRPRNLQAQCDQWNKAYPVGTRVEYHPVIGLPKHRIRTTRTIAQVLSGHTAVVWLDGESGCVALEACIPAQQETTGNDQPHGPVSEDTESPKKEKW